MKLYSNEIVFRGHPDKVCDQISDAILDACLKQDRHSRCGIEVMGGKSALYITGEITTSARIDIAVIARGVLERVGYPFMHIVVDIGSQSQDIARGTNDDIQGAGDNGMMFGFACRETPQMLPKAMVVLQEFVVAYDNLRSDMPDMFYPDGKSQITGEYDDRFFLTGIDTVTICYQNCETNRGKTDRIVQDAFFSILDKYNVTHPRHLLINPTGRFEIGGFAGDAGLTGRKIVVDSYHGFAPVGGGAFSGKDPTKVDRSGAYKARQIAKRYLEWYPNILWCQVQLSYSIGIREPMAIYVTSNNGDLPVMNELYDECAPASIIKDLGLLDVTYETLAAYGHFTS